VRAKSAWVTMSFSVMRRAAGTGRFQCEAMPCSDRMHGAGISMAKPAASARQMPVVTQKVA
jgi:hypothetical protein